MKRTLYTRARLLAMPVLLALGLMLAASAAAATSDRYVAAVTGSDDGDCSTQAAPCLTIQYAIGQAATSDTINIAAGTYDEQVVVDGKSLTLQGVGNTTIIAPSSAAELTSLYTTGTQAGAFFNGVAIASIIDVRGVGAAGVTIRDLKVDGQNITTTPAGAAWLSGITFGETGGLIHNVTVEDTDQLADTSIRTYSIWLDAVADTAVSVDVTDSTAFHYGRNGINARGDDIHVDITNNTITGPGMVGPAQVPNGVLLLAGPTGTVSGNTITANHYTGSSFLGSGVNLYQAGDGITISGNDITDTDDAVIINATDLATVSDNDLSGNVKGVRIEAGSAAFNTVTDNTILNNSLFGIELSDTVGTGNVANNNAIAGNAAGVSNGSTNAFDAECNWWGAASGPSGEGNGTGDSASTDVDFVPWLESSNLAGTCSGFPTGAVLTPASNDFGQQAIGTTSPPFTFTLTNEGYEDLTVSSVTRIGINPGQFEIDTNGCFEVVLGHDASCNIDVVFEPNSIGVKTAELSVSSDDPDSPHTAALAGEGVEPPAPGSIRIILDLSPNAATDFEFRGDLGTFILDDDANERRSSDRTWVNLEPGTYQIKQWTTRAAWSLTSISCLQEQATSLGNRTATIDLQPGEEVICVFTNVRRQPDGLIAKTQAGFYKGSNVYSSTPLKSQTQKRRNVAAGQTYTYFVSAQNDSLASDRLRIEGIETGASTITVAYFVNGIDRTAAIQAGTHLTSNLAPGEFELIEVRVTVAANASGAAKKVVLVELRSDSKPQRVDVVRAVTAR